MGLPRSGEAGGLGMDGAMRQSPVGGLDGRTGGGAGGLMGSVFSPHKLCDPK